MEPKKNPKYDVHQQRGIIFPVSLVMSLLIVITAFKWSMPLQTKNELPPKKYEDEGAMTYVPVVYEKQKDASVPKTAKQIITNSPNIIEVKNNPAAEDPSVEGLDPPSSDTPAMPFGSIDMPPEVPLDTQLFRIVEKMPEPVGGLKGFYETIQKNIRYPGPAKRSNISGKVMVEFVVNEDDHLSNFSILSGIGAGCDEEAMRVIGLTKWKAGKQRGRPVKVRMVLPLTFRLQ